MYMRAIVRLTVIYVEINWKNMQVYKYKYANIHGSICSRVTK